MKKWIVFIIIFITGQVWARGPGDPLPSTSQLVPCDSVWRTPIDSAPISSSNTAWTDTNNAHTGHVFHANFGTQYATGSTETYNGIPYNIVYSSFTPRVPVMLTTYATSSDTPPVGGVPIPPDAIAELDEVGGGGVNASPGDQHLLILDVSSGMIYEMFVATRSAPGVNSWTAEGLWIFNSTSNVAHPDGQTTADAAGLQITPGLLRYDEVDPVCNIQHAIRMEISLTELNQHIWPARHDTSSGGPTNVPFGARYRIKASVDCTVMSDTHTICICNAMKKYGMIMADNGGDWYIDGMPNLNWNDSNLHNDFITIGLPSATVEVVNDQVWANDPVNTWQMISTAAVSCVSVSPFGSQSWSSGISAKGAMVAQ
jgi:hypothetical protein